MFSTYGRIASHQKNDKIEKIKDPLDPNALVSFLWERTADCQRLDVAVGAPFTSEQIVQCAISAILSTGRHAEAHCNFMRTHQQNQRTCQNVINHFTQEHMLQNEAEVTTHQQGCANALQQLVNANVADCSAFSDSSNDQDSLQQAIDQMTTQNQQLQAQLAAQQQQMNLMQQQMANLMTQPPVAPSHNCHQPHRHHQFTHSHISPLCPHAHAAEDVEVEHLVQQLNLQRCHRQSPQLHHQCLHRRHHTLGKSLPLPLLCQMSVC